MSPAPDETIDERKELLVGSPQYGGSFVTTPACVAHPADQEIVQAALPFVLPGEQVRPASQGSPFPVILEPSADRVSPRCPHFGECGGCQYQHASYPAQLAIKREVLLGVLAAAGALPELRMHSAEPWRYRNRLRLRINPGSSPESFQVGYSRRGSNQFLPISCCPISAPVLLRTAFALVSLALEDRDAAAWLRAAGELEIFALPDESAVQLQLLLRAVPSWQTRAGRLEPLPTSHLPSSFGKLCESLRARVPELSGAGAEPLRPARANVAVRASHSTARLAPVNWGKAGLLYPVALPAAASLWVGRGSFFQVNRYLLPELVATALRGSAISVALAWDLFAGVGLFTRALLSFAERITAVELSPTAVSDLRAAHLPSVEVVASLVLDFLRSAVVSRDRPELVLLDPPRAGLGLEAAALLARIAPARIVYVSCDPVTLARDLGPMLSSGYQFVELHLVDMFPQTFHLETVAILSRTDLPAR